MYRIIYLSSASTKFTNEEILTILRNSRKNNDVNGITGLLLYSDGNFLQIIEGKKKVVKKLYEKICFDPRHKNIIKVFEDKVSSRIYPSWKMGFNILEKEYIQQNFNDDLVYENYDPIITNKDSVASVFIETFLKSSKEKIHIK